VGQIRELDAVLPEDVEYHYQGKTYTLPGDIDVEHTYELLDLLQKAGAIEDAVEKSGTVDFDIKRENDTKIRDALLALFRQRDPDLERLPFGVMGLRHVLTDVLVSIGFEFVPAGGADPPRRTASVKSKRSSSSRRSSNSSASRTKKS
jgi:hypothetical protein